MHSVQNVTHPEERTQADTTAGTLLEQEAVRELTELQNTVNRASICRGYSTETMPPGGWDSGNATAEKGSARANDGI